MSIGNKQDGRSSSRISFSGKGRTKQQFRDECDVNVLMRRYAKTGVLPPVSGRVAQHGFVPSFDFREAVELVREASELFDSQPSAVRRRFRNDPVEFMEFLRDPKNQDEAYALGLAVRPEPAPGGEAGGSGNPA